MTKLTNKVLVLGSDTRSFLAVIRSLGRAGKEVHVAWCARSSLAKTSRYVARVHTVDRPPARNWISEFRDLLDRERFDLIIPCNDPSILPLHEQRETLASYPIYLMKAEIFETVMDKAAVNEIAAKSGMKLPKEVIIRSLREFEKIDNLRPPFVLKPTQSYTVGQLSKKNHVTVSNDRETAREELRSILEQTPVAIQEHFQGRGVGVEFLADNGEILMAFQHRRLHEPPGGGGSSYRRSCQLDPQLFDATASLIKSLGYTGVGMAEYLYNFRSNEWTFVELNSRFWGSLPLAVACGADFPANLYDLLCHGRRDFPRTYRVNRTSRNWLMDIQWLRKTVAANGLNLPSQAALVWQLLTELQYPLTLRESSDTITRDDTAPGINEIKEALLEIPRRLQRKISRIKSGLQPYRNWQRRRLLRKAKQARTALFVCKGNICRSPFAEHYLQANPCRFERVESCGYFPKSNRLSPENAVTAACKFDIELSRHRSAEISSEMVDRSDVIFVFDEENYHTVRRLFPQSRAKTFLLGWIDGDSNAEIADPYGGKVEDFHLTYRQISSALDHLVSGNESDHDA